MNIRRITHGGWKFIREIGGTGRVSRDNGSRGEKSAIAAKKEERRRGRKKERKERGKRAAERMADNAEMQDGETGA